MDKELERPFMAEGEIAVGLSELHLAGRIEFKDDGEKFRLSDKGVDAGLALWRRLKPATKILLWSLLEYVGGIGDA